MCVRVTKLSQRSCHNYNLGEPLSDNFLPPIAPVYCALPMLHPTVSLGFTCMCSRQMKSQRIFCNRQLVSEMHSASSRALLVLGLCGACRAALPPQLPAWYTTHWHQQPVDHFNAEQNGTFQQRYLLNDTYWSRACLLACSRLTPQLTNPTSLSLKLTNGVLGKAPVRRLFSTPGLKALESMPSSRTRGGYLSWPRNLTRCW